MYHGTTMLNKETDPKTLRSKPMPDLQNPVRTCESYCMVARIRSPVHTRAIHTYLDVSSHVIRTFDGVSEHLVVPFDGDHL